MHNQKIRLLLNKPKAKKQLILFTISPSPSYTHTHSHSELELSWRLWSLQFPIHGNHYPWGKIMHFFPRVLSNERKDRVRVCVCVHMRSRVCISVSTTVTLFQMTKNWFNVKCQSTVALPSLRLCLSPLAPELSLLYQSITVKLQPTHLLHSLNLY